MRKVAAVYAMVWRASTPMMRLELVLSAIGPLAAGALIVTGHGIAGVIVLVVLVLDSALVWPVRRARRQRQSTRSHD